MWFVRRSQPAGGPACLSTSTTRFDATTYDGRYNGNKRRMRTFRGKYGLRNYLPPELKTLTYPRNTLAEHLQKQLQSQYPAGSRRCVTDSRGCGIVNLPSISATLPISFAASEISTPSETRNTSPLPPSELPHSLPPSRVPFSPHRERLSTADHATLPPLRPPSGVLRICRFIPLYNPHQSFHAHRNIETMAPAAVSEFEVARRESDAWRIIKHVESYIDWSLADRKKIHSILSRYSFRAANPFDSKHALWRRAYQMIKTWRQHQEDFSSLLHFVRDTKKHHHNIKPEMFQALWAVKMCFEGSWMGTMVRDRVNEANLDGLFRGEGHRIWKAWWGLYPLRIDPSGLPHSLHAAMLREYGAAMMAHIKEKQVPPSEQYFYKHDSRDPMNFVRVCETAEDAHKEGNPLYTTKAAKEIRALRLERIEATKSLLRLPQLNLPRARIRETRCEELEALEAAEAVETKKRKWSPSLLSPPTKKLRPAKQGGDEFKQNPEGDSENGGEIDDTGIDDRELNGKDTDDRSENTDSRRSSELNKEPSVSNKPSAAEDQPARKTTPILRSREPSVTEEMSVVERPAIPEESPTPEGLTKPNFKDHLTETRPLDPPDVSDGPREVQNSVGDADLETSHQEEHSLATRDTTADSGRAKGARDIGRGALARIDKITEEKAGKQLKNLFNALENIPPWAKTDAEQLASYIREVSRRIKFPIATKSLGTVADILAAEYTLKSGGEDTVTYTWSTAKPGETATSALFQRGDWMWTAISAGPRSGIDWAIWRCRMRLPVPDGAKLQKDGTWAME